MIRALFRRQVARFGRRYRYDTTYVARIVDTDLAAAVKLAMAGPFLDHRGKLPRHVWRAAHLRAVRAADCGPCLELAVAMAREEGMERATVAAILRGDPPGEDMALAVRYADAVLANDPSLPECIDAVEAQYGHGGLVALSIAVVAGGFYPLFKRGLGKGAACSPVLRKLEVE